MTEEQRVKQERQEWVYLQILLETGELESHPGVLANVGEDEWELVSATALNMQGTTTVVLYTFKKPSLSY